jgi:hypothetical protein
MAESATNSQREDQILLMVEGCQRKDMNMSLSPKLPEKVVFHNVL